MSYVHYPIYYCFLIAQLAGAVEYTNCRRPPHPTNVLDVTLDNLMVRFQ